MRVLLTGASGFLGRYVLDNLHRRGIETVVVGRQLAANQADSPFIGADLLTVTDFSWLVKQANATHLLHMAWYAEHGRYWTSPLNLRWVEATIRLVEAFCEAGGQQVVVAGTCAEYDWSSGVCREEETPLHPATLYGISKDATRRLIMGLCARYQVQCGWGRVFFPFGTGEAKQRLIPSLIQVLQGNRPPFAVNCRASRDFLHALDVAEGFITLLLYGQGTVCNISSSLPVRLGDVVHKLAHILNVNPQNVLDLSIERPGEPLLLVGENLKLTTLGWTPVLSLEQGLERTVREQHACH